MANAIIKKAVDHLKTVGIDAFENDYVAVDKDYSSIYLNTTHKYDEKGNEIEEHLYDALELSVPLRRSISKTSADMGMQYWHERGLEFSWSFHPDRGTRISILTSRA